MYNANPWSSNALGVLEGKSEDTFGSFSCDELDGLHNTINNYVLNARVFSLGVLSDEDSVDVIVWGFVTSDRSAGTDVGEKVECTTESKVKRDMALSNWRLRLSVNALYPGLGYLTAKGPFSATLFLSMLSIVSGAMTVFPSTKRGVTSTGSHLIGV